MAARHFINDPTHLVATALKSITATNPSVALDAVNKIVYKRPGHAAQVSIVSGGGSGHEPSFGAFVGQGLLSAAVAGSIFSSPATEQILRAIEDRVDSSKGVLVTVMNYTGDVLNFGVAVEKAKAAGLSVAMLVVGDDVGVPKSAAGKVGRRGIAGTVLVHKITGALAASGANLNDVYSVGKLVADNTVSVGASLDHVHVPGRPADTEESVPMGKAELGMGIHNEPGSGRAAADLPSLVKSMLEQLLSQNDKERSFLRVNSNEPVVMINNLGGLSILEMGGITTEVLEQLKTDYNIVPVRTYSGTFMTSLNGLGFSISILNVVNTNIGGPSMIQLLDAPSEAAGWSAFVRKETWESTASATLDGDSSTGAKEIKPSGLDLDTNSFAKTLTVALQNVIAAEPAITKFDTVVGDGDCGTTLKRGSEGILKFLQETKPLPTDVVILMTKIVEVVESTMDGTSGALYSIFLNSLVQSLRLQASNRFTWANTKVWTRALQHAAEGLGRYTPARVGDRTLVDALHPFIETLSSTGDVGEAAKAAHDGTVKTKGMKASLGRTVYVGGQGYTEVPDPGAWGLSQFFLGLAGVEHNDEDFELV